MKFWQAPAGSVPKFHLSVTNNKTTPRSHALRGNAAGTLRVLFPAA
ncbi:MAG: hypothetical protein GY749_25210 [Desulfobacteraceae bacterium]|nr:hypothetical protein [Desulfobacteraceae bacterium]